MADLPNLLFYGDNLDVLRLHVADESIDLVYLDPPFNSNRSYNVLFRSHSGEESQAQIEAFDDTWRWSQQTDQLYEAMVLEGQAPPKVADAIEAMRKLLGTSDVLAYLVMMTVRLVELHRVLRSTGSLYLHCDPTASHYLKVLLDAIFGPERFLNEVIWKRTSAHNRLVSYGPIHDILLCYTKSDKWTWNPQHTAYDDSYTESFYRHVELKSGRRYRLSDVTSNNPGGRYLWKGQPPPGNRYWGYSEKKMEEFEAEGRLVYSKRGIPSYKRYLDEMPGQLLQDVWADIRPLSSRSQERLGYPTQKPLALLERIIQASSSEGDVVLDPFCGCGTTIDAAEKLRRRWIGMDVTYLAVDLIQKRLRHTYGPDIEQRYVVHGIPTDMAGAQALFAANPFDFERWAVGQVNGQPNEKQVGDRGVDGRMRFPVDNSQIGTVLISVKGGRQVNPGMVRDLVGTIAQQRADMGLLILLGEPTKGMREVVDQSGYYLHPLTHNSYPKVQMITVTELLAGKRPNLPAAINPYIQAKARGGEQMRLL